MCFRNVADDIIAKPFKDKEIQKLSECERIIQTAAKFIKSDKIAQFASNYYPSKLNLKNYDESLPQNLHSFMKALVLNEVKQASTGHVLHSSTIVWPGS